jgi:hypothetical protein
MPARLLTHAWRAARTARARQFRSEVGRLVLKLSDILRAAFSHSQAGRQPQSLQASLGGAHQDAFDFDALSRIVGKGAPRDELPPARRARLERTLAVLQSQRFHAAHEDADADEVHRFEFDNCAAAMEAWRERLPEVAELVRAIAIAELEVAGRYVEAEHDPVFDVFDAAALGADDLARFPDYLVCIPPGRNDAGENAGLMDMLSSGLPVKVLVQTSDLLEDTSIGTGHFAFGVRSARLATAAMGLGGMYVLQSVSSNLPALRREIARGLECPARRCSASTAAAAPARPCHAISLRRPPCSRAPFRPLSTTPRRAQTGRRASRWRTIRSPTATGRSRRLATATTPNSGSSRPAPSPTPTSCSAIRAMPRISRWCRARTGRHDAAGERVAASLTSARRQGACLTCWAVDADDALQRVIVDARVLQATRRCLLLWHRLQEHAGIHDSHAERLLASERAAWADSRREAQPTAAPVAAAPAAASPASEPETAAPARSRDEAWIETSRCPSCNECQLINDRMFAYDERKQAYIKDLAAGTYRQLVEAAESCQVAIIHPGKPRDPNEPGLEELLVRAEPFR